jgi:uncharacterized membrane protein
MRHSFGRWASTVAALVAFACAPVTAQVPFQVTIQEFLDQCYISGMSADGSVIVGNYGLTASNANVFRWTAAGGVQLIGVPNMLLNISISRDGSTIVGSVPDAQGNYNAAIWRGGTMWQLLPLFPGAVAGQNHTISVATGVSANGSVIVGYGYVSGTSSVAFRWDAVNGTVNLGTFNPGPNSSSQATGISADGLMVVGWDYEQGFTPGGKNGAALNGKRGAIWWDGNERLLHPLGWAGAGAAANHNGSVIVGQFDPFNTNNAAGQASTYLWTAWNGSFADLGAVQPPAGAPPSEYISQPDAVSDDGSLVGGDTGNLQKFAMIWTQQTGMMYMTNFLTLKGVTAQQQWVSLTETTYISPDGRIVAGLGFDPQNRRASWIVTLH